ncbi:MAG TPA: 4-hydroxy-tetrahydrodipicolinate reductase [Rhodanobacteraceae bacterium]|nr:4-hydroxy-tetrahydrodipicolinate reductase [Rhodanobacteraceae bacterium]
MPDQFRLAINGANGRMGQALQDLLHGDARFELIAAVGASSEWRNVPKLDVVVDFSSPAGFDAALAHCVDQRTALVSGTTGLGDSQGRALTEAARVIPVLHAANFSLGIAVLTRVLRDAAAALPGWDLEILEAHHARKVDAPSGTALALGRAAAAARGQDFEHVAVLARHGHTGARPENAIGFSSIRAGEIVGEHTALLATRDERIELTHRAYDNTIFARGALVAAAWIARKPPGAYTIDDVIGAPGR